MSKQKRVARKADDRVAQRTREVAIANEARRESERHSQLVVDSIPGLIAPSSPTVTSSSSTARSSNTPERTLAELKHWGTDDTVHFEDLPHVIQVFTSSIASGSPYEIVQRLRRADGVYRWFQNNGFPVRDANGQIVRWCVLLTDVPRAEAR